ncbi:mucin-5AC-like [Lytechinus pictus]|uniref:mucin-5AC-like n=1 Tax=Lytechinus pictus TaxID=7653 RepID=UPI0030B9DC7C
MDALDNSNFPTAQAMSLIPVAPSALPPNPSALRSPPSVTIPVPTSGGLKGASSSKPGRYEAGVDTTPLTPPSSSHNLQLVFDSSKIYDNHPRKYRLLLELDKDNSVNSKNISKSALSATNATRTQQPSPPSVIVEDGQVIAMGTTSSGPSAGPSPTPDPAAAPPKSLPTSGAPFTLSEAVSSLAIKKEKGESKYVPQEFLKTFKAATTLGPPSNQKNQQRSGSYSGPSSSSAEIPLAVGIPSSGIVRESLAPIPKIVTPESCGANAPAGCTVLQPEPRRLFGFGPLYRPLPETVCATGERRQSSPTLHVPGNLSEAVGREGITGAGYSGARRASDCPDGVAPGTDGHKKKSPTPAELNVWLGGSF